MGRGNRLGFVFAGVSDDRQQDEAAENRPRNGPLHFKDTITRGDLMPADTVYREGQTYPAPRPKGKVYREGVTYPPMKPSEAYYPPDRKRKAKRQNTPR